MLDSSCIYGKSVRQRLAGYSTLHELCRRSAQVLIFCRKETGRGRIYPLSCQKSLLMLISQHQETFERQLKLNYQILQLYLIHSDFGYLLLEFDLQSTINFYNEQLIFHYSNQLRFATHLNLRKVWYSFLNELTYFSMDSHWQHLFSIA